MKKPAHVIGKLVYDMDTSLPEEESKEFFAEYNYLLKEQLPKILEDVLNEFSVKNSFIRIDKLEIDLGKFNRGHLEEDVPYAFREALRRTLEKLIQDQQLLPDQNVLIVDEKQEALNTFIYYLKYGALPWFAKAGEINFSFEQVKKILNELEQNQKVVLRKEFSASPEIRKRFILQFKQEDLPQYVKNLFPEQTEAIKEVPIIEKVIALSGLRLPEKVIRQLIWEAILENPEHSEVFWDLIIPKIAREGFLSPKQTFIELSISSLEVKGATQRIFNDLEKAALKKEDPKIFYREIIENLLSKERFEEIEKIVEKRSPDGKLLVKLAKDLVATLQQFAIDESPKKQFIYKELFIKEALTDIALPSEEKVLQLIKQLTEKTETSIKEATKAFQASTSGKRIIKIKEQELEKLIVKLSEKAGEQPIDERENKGQLKTPTLIDLPFQHEVLTIVEQAFASEGKGLAQREKMAIGILIHYLNFAHVPAIIFSSSGINDLHEFEEIISRLIIKNRDFVHRLVQRSNTSKDPIVPMLLKTDFSANFHAKIFDALPAEFRQEAVIVKSFLNTIITEQALPWYYLNSEGMEPLMKAVSQFIQKSPDTIQEILPVLSKEPITLLEKYLRPEAVKLIRQRVEEKQKAEEQKGKAEEISSGKKTDEEKKQKTTTNEEKKAKHVEKGKRELDDTPTLEDKKLLFIITHFVKHKELPTGIHTPIEDVIKTALSKAAKVAAIMFAGFTPEEMDVLKKEVSKATMDNIQKAIENNLKTMEEQKHKTFKNELDKGEPVYINNSGMALLHPFLQRYFTHLELMEKRKFVDEEAQIRAAYLLHYIVFKEENPAEHDMLLNKVFCGIELKTPLDRDITLTDKEKELSESLLGGVIQNWGVLKKTSPDNFRVSFLQREGKLFNTGNAYHLKIERRGYDVLIDRLPWGLGMVKLPWMEKFIQIDWS
ncbi:MAG: contractile injection system tape measure protein [Cytophagaceae bacterium]